MFFTGGAIGKSVVKRLMLTVIGFGPIDHLRVTSAWIHHNKATTRKTNHYEPNRKSRKYYNRDFELRSSLAGRGRAIGIVGNGMQHGVGHHGASLACADCRSLRWWIAPYHRGWCGRLKVSVG